MCFLALLTIFWQSGISTCWRSFFKNSLIVVAPYFVYSYIVRDPLFCTIFGFQNYNRGPHCSNLIKVLWRFYNICFGYRFREQCQISGPKTHFRLQPEVLLKEWLTPNSTRNTQLTLNLWHFKACKTWTSGLVGEKSTKDRNLLYFRVFNFCAL